MQISDLKVEELFDLTHTRACAYLKMFTYPWEALAGIALSVDELSETLGEEFKEVKRGVFVHRGAKIATSAELHAPCIIGASEVRSGALIRGGVLVGDGCVVGNSVELKNCILFDGVQVPHFNYVGDSILGYKAHLGAGAVTSNVKLERTMVKIKIGEKYIPTGRKKCGAFLGDFAEVGCNAVLNPGTVVGRKTTVYPLTLLRGAYPADSIVKGSEVVKKR